MDLCDASSNMLHPFTHRWTMASADTLYLGGRQGQVHENLRF